MWFNGLSRRWHEFLVERGKGYTGETREVIFTIISLTELSKIKAMIFAVDSNAFVVVNDTLEVLGRQHGPLKVY